MKHRLIAAQLIIFVLVAATSGHAQFMRKTGITGASILKVAVGARAAALGTAVTSETGDVNQLFWNPAGIAIEEGKTQLTFSYNNWIADLNHNAFAVSHDFGNLGTLAVGAMMAGVNDIQANRDYVDNLNITYNTDATFNYNSFYVALGYAKQFTNKLSLGVTGKYYREEIDVESASAVAVDFGAIYRIGFRDLTLGARIQNIGSDLQYYFVPASLPLVFSFGVSMSMIDVEGFSLKGFADATKPLDTDQQIIGSFEASLLNNIHLRGGYKFNLAGTQDSFNARSSYQRIEDQTREHWYDTRDYYRTDEDLSLGAGIEIPYSDKHMVIDYSWTKFRLLDNVNRFSFTFKF